MAGIGSARFKLGGREMYLLPLLPAAFLLLLAVLPFTSPNASVLLLGRPLIFGFSLLLSGIFCVVLKQKFHRDQRRLYESVCHMVDSGEQGFFPSLASRLSEYFGANYVHIGRFDEPGDSVLKTVAACRDGRLQDDAEYDPAGLPCARVAGGDACFVAAGLGRRYPEASLISQLQVVSFMGYPMRDAQGEVVGAISVYASKPLRRGRWGMALLALLARHASLELERAKVQQVVNRMAYHDPLTEMPNWRFFRERLLTTLGQAGKLDRCFGLMFLDVDRFKNVNQAFGHETGDLLLRLFAERLARSLGERAALARKGGDRFFILLPEVEDKAEVRQVAERLMAMAEEPFPVQGREVYLSLSVGVVAYPEDGENIAALLANADTAMHRAKERGGGCVESFAPAMGADGRMRLGLEGALRKALKRNEFLLHYQPQYELQSERVVGEEGLLQERISSRLVGAECLIRWRHSGRGLVPPMEFIPLAEQIGLIEEIGAWVLETACSQLQVWQQWFGSDLKMSVNLSARQLYDPALVDRVAGVLKVNGLRPETLCLEITESCLMANVQETQQQLQRLRRLGVGIAIDDFGTGYSSLSYLRRFPVSSLKIDRSFVRDICSHADQLAIVKNIIAIADSLKLDVVSEGVETRQQLSCLCAAGCRTVQGYLLDRPLPAEDFAMILNAAGGRPLVGPDSADSQGREMVGSSPGRYSSRVRPSI